MRLDCRELADKKIQELKKITSTLKNKPTLVIIKVGNDPASERYVNNKVRRCEEVGIKSLVVELDPILDNNEVERVIKDLNTNPEVTGILLQLPLPKHLDESYLTQLIAPEKDVDGFTRSSQGSLMIGEDGLVPCTPYGIIEILKHFDIPIEGQDVLIINRSNIVGKPLAMLFLKENATVTIAHSKTLGLKDKMKQADIVVTAIGKPNSFGYYDFKDGSTIIDVSINFDENGKMCGDVMKYYYEELDFINCKYTPVPFGVGQLTVISLIEQTIKIALKNEGRE